MHSVYASICRRRMQLDLRAYSPVKVNIQVVDWQDAVQALRAVAMGEKDVNAAAVERWLQEAPRSIKVHALCIALVIERGGSCLAGGSRILAIAGAAPEVSRRVDEALGLGGNAGFVVGLERSAGGIVPWFAAGQRGESAGRAVLRGLL